MDKDHFRKLRQPVPPLRKTPMPPLRKTPMPQRFGEMLIAKLGGADTLRKQTTNL